jgi:hypothetical protein
MAGITTNGTFDCDGCFVHGKPLGALKGAMSFFGTNVTKLLVLEGTV